MRSRAAAVAAALLLASCAVGPDFKKPVAPDEAGYSPGGAQAETATTDVAGGEAQRFVEDKDIPGQWWALFHSAALNQLIAEALKSNPTLDAAQASLRQAQENAAAQGGVFLPSVTGGFSSTREKISGAQQGEPNFSTIFTYTSGAVNVSYVLRRVRWRATPIGIARGASRVSALSSSRPPI